ncbi:MAG: EamA family transporter [Schaalia hyovaginalis]|uniref:EamA family transporter n=1 Tax=Schaalia hyovaginalis TaxID=29316 RepID=UPI0023F78AFE|nr:EamA family transporter [Schaalia hyovaginalis]MCI7671753.1 EamA family transporter [Schaalia hyovaginalis]MDY5506602.1 EamA family transporter [Schaalia hyovaginalis]
MSPRVLDRVPAQALIIVDALFQYVGAAFAVAVFALMEPASVAWWRVLVGALILLAWRRPWRFRWTWRELGASAVFGLFILAMNSTFYEAIARLPLGAAVSIEFLGPVSVAVVRGRGWAPRVAALMAFAGVASISGFGVDPSDPGIRAGIAWILAAAAAWAGYIVVGQAIASRRSGVTNLSMSLGFGALFAAPLLAPGGLGAFTSWTLLGSLVLVGLLSTAIPFTLEALAMSRLTAATYALLTALMPATSAVVGAVMLRQIPTPGELLGLVLISIAVWIASSPRLNRASA